MNSSKGNNALNKMPSTVSLSESEPCQNSMEELKARLSKAFVNTDIVIEGDGAGLSSIGERAFEDS